MINQCICSWSAGNSHLGSKLQRPVPRLQAMASESRSPRIVCIKGVRGRQGKRRTALKGGKRKIQNKRDWRKEWIPLISYFNSHSFQIAFVSSLGGLSFPVFFQSKNIFCGSAAPAAPGRLLEPESPASPQTYWTRICILTRSPGNLYAYEKFGRLK